MIMTKVQVPELTLDRVTMELRRQDKDRDRVLPGGTIEGVFQVRYPAPLVLYPNFDGVSYFFILP